VKKLDGVIGATPFIAERFIKIKSNTIAVNNYPLESEIEFVQKTNSEKVNSICYIGGISQIRGIESLVKSMEFTDVKLELAGAIAPEFRAELIKLNGWEKVNELGFIDRQTSMQLKQQSIAGIVTFLPFPNHINAQPNKIFEYMAAGLPVIGSYFPLWKSLIEKNNCGICVDPSNPNEIADAINKLVNDKALAKKMGENGRKLVQTVYHWNAEEKVLIDFYQSLIAK
jgi:glycosyltransferase involved in cell wall biosynthesis